MQKLTGSEETWSTKSKELGLLLINAIISNLKYSQNPCFHRILKKREVAICFSKCFPIFEMQKHFNHLTAAQLYTTKKKLLLRKNLIKSKVKQLSTKFKKTFSIFWSAKTNQFDYLGNEKEVISLIQNGANVNFADEDGFTPLYSAAYAGNKIRRIINTVVGKWYD